MEENKRGGKRIGSGRKPITNPKVQVTLYVEKNKIWVFGNVDKMKTEIYGFISNFGIVKEKEQPEQTYTAVTARVYPLTTNESYVPKQTSVNRTPYEWVELKREITEGDNDAYQKWIMELDADTSLTKKEKQLIKLT